MRVRADVPSEPMPGTAANDAPRRSAKFKARRDAIVDSSASVFARRGYHATGIAELCEVNGLGKGAFYHYIGSKEELLAAIHDRVMDEVMLGADRVAHAGGSPSAQLVMLGEELLDVIHRYPDHVWVFLHEFPALTGERAERFRLRRREYERRVESVLQAGIEKAQSIEEARATARSEAEAVAEQERSRLATERQQVLLGLRTEIGELAFTLAEKLVRESLREEDRQRRLVDEFIAGVGATVQVEAETTHAGR